MKIAILDDYQDAVRKLDCFHLLDDHEVKVFNNTVRGLGQLASRLSEVDALVLIRERTRISSQLLDKCPKLRMISQTGRAGGGHIDVDACTERGIAVLEGTGSPVAPAELTWALIMSAQRRIPQYVANLKQGAWQQSGLKTSALPPNFGLGQVLRGQTLGIVKQDDLMRMKPTALFVNTSRAELLEENALLNSLHHNRPGMVAVDVFESEPILQGYGLLRLENVICTPHIGYVERESYELYFGAAFRNILAFDAGDTSSVFNKEALQHVRRR
jgi:phosphoglycerate dehydrogenase-like enzyme